MERNIQFTKGQILDGKYTIKSLLGEGGIAKTYLSTDKSGNKLVIKILDFSNIKDWKVFELFEREISTLQNLDHELIPDYIDNFKQEIDGNLFYGLVQEYVKGRNFYDHVKSGKRLTVDKIKLILESLLNTLDYIHNLHPPIIHRDINPKNIILSNDGKVYLVDFGAVGNIVKDTMAAAMSSTFVGTIGYMPPEQLFGKVTPGADIYSLGVTMVYLLTGKEPLDFEFKNLKLDISDEESIPVDLKELINGMIEPDADKRFSNIKEILDVLKGIKTMSTDYKKENKADITDSRMGVAFRFYNNEEVYSLKEFENVMKKYIFNGTLNEEILNPKSKFFKAANVWFKNYFDSSYPEFFWDTIANFLEENEDSIKNKNILKNYNLFDKNRRKMLRDKNSQFIKEKKNKIREATKKITHDDNKKKAKITTVFFIALGLIIFSTAIYLFVYSISLGPRRVLVKGVVRTKRVLNPGKFIAIFANLLIWGNLFGIWVMTSFAKFINSRRKVKITGRIQSKVEAKKSNIEHDFKNRYNQYDKKSKTEVFKSFKIKA